MMDLLLTIPYIFLSIVLIYKLKYFKILGISAKELSVILVLKVVAGFTLVLVYTYYYTSRSTADVFKYFDDANVLYSALKNNPSDYFKMLTGIKANEAHLMQYYDTMNFWLKEFDYNLYNDNRTVIRFNAFIRLISFGSIYVHTVFFAFISFIGLTGIYKIFVSQFENKKYLLIIAIYFLPSVIFWTSGALKEAILIFAFGCFFYSLNKILINIKNLKLYFVLLLSLFILSISKFYVLIAALPGIITLILFKITSSKFAVLKFIVVHIVLLLILLNIDLAFKQYNFIEIIANKQKDFINLVDSLPDVGSKIIIPVLEPNIKSLVINTPHALKNTLFRPYIWEAKSISSLLAAIENLLFIAIFLFAIILRKKDYKMTELNYFSLSFIIILLVLTGLTTPVLGAIVRYKVPALPFLALLIFDLIDIEKIRKTLKIKI